MHTTRDTYITALRHELVNFPEDTTFVGVVRRPTNRLRSVIDENCPSLGPPPDLSNEFKQLYEDFKMQGMCDDGAHNAAWDVVGFADRYRSHLTTDSDARKALAELTDRLQTDERLVLVCYENTDRKRCHRTLLQNSLAAKL
ncbi:DUF488 family protein, N3 subclade [Halocatena pleomorpha]|uniref:DUF488 family protein n=1 Tax=Halocatena pleomorpha TaxID=1785090 RepID=A0A3P3RDD3_9EURY|nr:DUF488 family protein [Halocatena pleomorpha]RRJ31517.1 DUF488 family protein [Halocatena pleomorpha]